MEGRSVAHVNMVTIKFCVRYGDTRVGQHLIILGNTPQLGDWDVSSAVELKTAPSSFPIWYATVQVEADTFVEYKYAILEHGKLVRWENRQGNRYLCSTGTTIMQDTFDDEHYNSIPFNKHQFHQIRVNFGLRDTNLNSSIHLNIPNTTSTQFKIDFVPVNDTYEIEGINPHKEGTDTVFSAPKLADLRLYLNVFSKASGSDWKWVGRAILEPLALLAPNPGTTLLPIIDKDLNMIGSCSCRYLIASPFNHHNNIPTSFEGWRPHADFIGHRGFGTSRTTFIRENTLLSFNTAHLYGIRYVEFDVQLSHDKVPIIYHDFFIPIEGKLTSLTSLSLEQFKPVVKNYHQQILHDSTTTRLRRTKSFSDLKHPKQEAKWLLSDDTFPAFEDLFHLIPTEVGFNIEIKYPDLTTKYLANAIERNEYLDIILKVVFDHAQERSCYFSTFDPELCILLLQKQQRYPVFFLSVGRMALKERGDDPRCNSILGAATFAASVGCHGIVVDCVPLMSELASIQKVKEKGLLLFTYGRFNNDPDYVHLQRKMGVDAIISDQIPKVIKPTKNFHELEKQLKTQQIIFKI